MKCSTSHVFSGSVVTGLLLLLLGGLPASAGAQDQEEQPAPVVSTSAASVWGANYFPNVPLVTHEGETMRFFDDMIEGKVVVINFIYTTCPDSCPLETARLKEVREILGDRVGKDVFIYSITIDPDTDTPEVLADYAERYRTGPGWWFLTGDEDDIILLRKKLGLYIDEIQEEDSNDHNLSLMIGNQATGRWMKRSPFENPYVLANELGDWLHNYKAPRKVDNSYEDAPELRSITQGEGLFRTRCAVCHAVGTQDAMPRVGPDLYGVLDRRDRDWLERWIAAPDEMLAAKDPIATGLFLAFNRVPMPNFRLNPKEIDSLLDFIETETKRVEALQEIESLEEDDSDEPAACCLKKDNLTLGDVEKPIVDDEADDTEESSFDFARASVLGLGWGLMVLTVIFRRRSAAQGKA